MVKRSLNCFNSADCNSVQSLRVEVQSTLEGDLQLHYELTGDLIKLRIPAPHPPAQVEELWNHTCFEVFVGVEGEPGYHEFNFSPSGQWAAYAFSDYRKRIVWAARQAPEIITTRDQFGQLKLKAYIGTEDMPENMTGKRLQLGLAAVIESNDGDCSYWALLHPSERPDFHHRAGFACILSP